MTATRINPALPTVEHLSATATASSGTTVYRCDAYRCGPIVALLLQFKTTVTGNNVQLAHINGIPKPTFQSPIVSGIGNDAALVQLTTNCDVTSGGSSFRGNDWLSITLIYMTGE